MKWYSMRMKNILTVLLAIASLAAADFSGTSLDRDADVTLRSVNDASLTIRVTPPKNSHAFIASKISLPVAFSAPAGSRLLVVKVVPPAGTAKEDDTVLTGPGDFIVHIDGGVAGPNTIDVRYQLCLDDAGVCLSPKTKTISFDLAAPAKSTLPKADLFESLATSIEGTNVAFALLLCFIAGIASFLLPCVYPLIPITVSYLGTRGEKKGTFAGAALFGLGIVVTYTALGIAVSLIGRVRNVQFGSIAYHPAVLIPLVLFFIYFAFSMLNFYEFKVPGFLTKVKDDAYQKGNSFVGKFFMGAVTGLVASPCVGPVVATILGVSLTQPQYGYLYMFFYALGFASVLVVLGTFSSLLGKLPKSGGWMDMVKYVFALLMLGFTAYYLNLLLLILGIKTSSVYITVAIFSLVAAILTVFTFKSLDDYLKGDRIKALIVLLLFLAGLTVYQAVRNETAAAPTVIEEKKALSFDEALAMAKSEKKLVFIDFYTVWCENCEVLSRTILMKPPVKNLLAKKFIVLKIDADKEPWLRDKYGVKHYPWLTVVDSTGRLVFERSRFGIFDKALAEEMHAELTAAYSNAFAK